MQIEERQSRPRFWTVRMGSKTMPHTPTTRVEYYRVKSAECSELAARVKDPNAANLFRALAVDYFELAAKNAKAAGMQSAADAGRSRFAPENVPR
jgi:hypothetical protein